MTSLEKRSYCISVRNETFDRDKSMNVLSLRLRLQMKMTLNDFIVYRVHIPSEQYAICYEFTWSSNFVDVVFYLQLSFSPASLHAIVFMF